MVGERRGRGTEGSLGSGYVATKMGQASVFAASATHLRARQTKLAATQTTIVAQ